ncbi:hypothetical protein ACFY4C_37025 [Actinomadura viridis]|uniref:hypothetical protein n=1 Tax=Actinomadura viridis TaxID=58110 RepID=UPI00368199C9
MFTVDDFLDALELDSFSGLFLPLGFAQSPVFTNLYSHTGRDFHSALTLPSRRDPDGRCRQEVLAAARTYTELTGRRLWWIPQTDTEAAYASLLIGLLFRIRTKIEDSDGWNGGDVVELLCEYFPSLGLDINAYIPGLNDDEADTIDARMFLRAFLGSTPARQHRDLFGPSPSAPS